MERQRRSQPVPQARSVKTVEVEGDATEVDWNTIEDELENINQVWKQPRFDSLPHVVEVLTSRDPQVALRALRKQRDAIEELVDDVVHGYHSGFNRAIHNYSQILRLFSQSASMMSGLKQNLAEARRLLGARHKQLQQLWYRSITLRHIITLLDQIDNVAKVPARIEKLMAERKYYAAVQILLHSQGLVEREGIQGVGALKEVRNELRILRHQLFVKTVDDLQHHLYNKGVYSVKEKDRSENDDDISAITVAPVPAYAPLHPMVAQSGLKVERPSKVRPRSVRRSPSDSKSLSIDVSQREDSREDDDGPGTPGSEVSASSSRPDLIGDITARRLSQPARPPWLSETNHDSFTDAMSKSEAPQPVKYLQTMVEILAMLGRIPAAGAIVSQKLRGAVRERIIAEIKGKAAAAEAARPRMEPASRGGAMAISPHSRTGGNGFGASTPGRAKPASLFPSARSVSKTASKGAAAHQKGAPAAGVLREGAAALVSSPMHSAQVAAHELLESVMGVLLRVLANHVVVGELMEKKAVVSASLPGASLLHASGEGEAEHHLVNAPTGGYSVAFAWSCIQSEVQQLICDILRATPDGASGDAATARIANLRISNGASQETEITFSFRFSEHNHAVPGAGESMASTLGGDGLFHANKRRGAALGQEGYGTAAILTERGIYLTSACYRPVLQFTDKVCKVLPHQYAELGQQGLRPFIDSTVKDQFLPSAHVDYRSRVADALSSPSAFRPKARNMGSYESSLEAGRPILQGPLMVEQLVGEVLLWAQAMPVYAHDFVVLIQTLLERTLERCRAVYTEAVLGSVSSGLVGRADLERLMKQQTAALLVEEAELSPLELEQAREDPPPDSDAYDVDMELYRLLFQLRPIKEEQLILDPHKLVLLGALSDTLDHLSDSISLLGQAQFTPSSVAKKKGKGMGHRRTPSSTALTSGLAGLAAKYRTLAKECLRTLRLEFQVQTIFQLQAMAGKSYIREVDAEEPEDFIVALTSQMMRTDEEMVMFIPPARRCYVFGGVCGLAATGLIRALGEVEAINSLGVRQVQRNCIALQQILATLGANSSASVQQSLDRVSEYYELLNRPYEALMAYVRDHDRYFSFDEYVALLRAKVPGRDIPSDAITKIGKILAP